nr:hypothetical protein Iba_chr12aCG8810 [Ipomoea batatas]
MVPTTDHCYVENDERMEKETNSVTHTTCEESETRTDDNNQNTRTRGTSIPSRGGRLGESHLDPLLGGISPTRRGASISLNPNSGIELNTDPPALQSSSFRSSNQASQRSPWRRRTSVFPDGQKCCPSVKFANFPRNSNEISSVLRTGQEKKERNENNAIRPSLPLRTPQERKGSKKKEVKRNLEKELGEEYKKQELCKAEERERIRGAAAD